MSSSSSSSSASTAPSRGAGYGERRNCPLVALSKSQDARLGRYDPLAHQAAPDRVECFVDGPYRGTQQSSTTVVQSGGRWCEVEVTVQVIVSEEVRLHDRGADKALAERASTACKEAIAGSDFAQGLLQDELVGGFFEPREHLRRDPPPSSRDARRRHSRSRSSSRSRSPRRSRSRSRSRHYHHHSSGRDVAGFGQTVIPKDDRKLSKAEKKFLANQKREERWRLKQREAAKEKQPADSSEVFERPPLFVQQKKAEAAKSLTPKTPSPKSAQQALTIKKPILVTAPAPTTLPPPPPAKLPPPPPESEGLVALYKWWELVKKFHPDVPERDKPSHSYEEATRNTCLRFVRAAAVYGFMREFPEPEPEPIEEVIAPYFQLDCPAYADGQESPEQVSSSDDTQEAKPKN